MKAIDLKAKLALGGTVFGTMVYAATGIRWERMLSGGGIDFFVLDAEHAPRDRDNWAQWAVLAHACELTIIVRVPATQPHYVAMALDSGADGVLVPYMEDLDEVRACAATARWHPLKGEYLRRASSEGVFPNEKTRAYLERRHRDQLLIVGIESVPAVKELDRILEVEGIGALFVGPNDLTTSLGIPDDVTNPVYVDTLKEIVSKAEKRKVPVMIHHQTPASSRLSIEVGARMVMHSSDAGMLVRTMQSEFAGLREVLAGRRSGPDGAAPDDTLEPV